MNTTNDIYDDKGNTPKDSVSDSDSSVYEERMKDLTDKIIDEDRNLELRSLNSTSATNLGIANEELVKIMQAIHEGGGQSLPFKADFNSEEFDLDYFLFVPLLAHELAKKRSLELQIEKDPSLGLKPDFSNVKKIEIDGNLNAKLYKGGTEPAELVAGYSWKDIRKQGKNFIQMAYSAIEKNDKEVARYLRKRGFLKNGKLDDSSIENIVRNILGDELRGKLEKELIAKVSFASPDKNPRGKREQNFAGVVHENAVYIGMYGTTYGGRVVLFSEYFPHIKSNNWKRQLNLKQKLGMARDTANALIFLYRVGAVSRDIKPDNVLTDGKKTKVLDLGLVKHEKNGHSFMESLTGTDSLLTAIDEKPVLGSVYYMSPEQARGDNTDIGADIWGLGGTLYFALEGENPNQESDLPLMGPDKVALRIIHNLLSNDKRPKEPDLKQFEDYYLENMGFLGRVLTKSRFTNYFRKKARQYAHDATAVLAGCRSFNRENRYELPEEIKEDLEALIECRRPKTARKLIKESVPDLRKMDMVSPKKKTGIFGTTEDRYKLEAFEKVRSRPRYIFQKMRNAVYAAAGAAAGVAAYMPEKVIGYIPEQADKYMQMVNDFVQKVL